MKRIVLVRPAVEAGERLGFLPGDLAQKVDPYLRPLYDALYDLMGFDKVGKLFERGAIEIAPLAYMRGRTLNHSFIILDEAQNTTPEQMKMFLTRIGFGTKAVVTGDVTQIDLARGQKSGLVEARRILDDVRGIAFTHFTRDDVVRHPLVQRIVDAYEQHAQKRSSRTRVSDAPARADRAIRRARATACRRARQLRALGARPRSSASARVTLRFVGGAKARALNRDFRGKDYATNVLTFVVRDAAAARGRHRAVRAGGARARRARRASALAAHYAHLVVHGMLHLQGYDHERDARRARDGSARDRDPGAPGFADPYAVERLTRLTHSPRPHPATQWTLAQTDACSSACRRCPDARARGPRAAGRAAALAPTSATCSTPTRCR